jgi:molecular chaperone HtpG
MVQEKRKFDADVSKVLHLMIHSLYSNKEIFMRELISNSSDACDKLRYLIQTKTDFSNEDSNFKITIRLDKTSNTITIHDNGIGMNYADLNNNLGTIAKSGTQRFINDLTERNDTKRNSLIGQFGVGFYSSFMVADQITVTSKKAREEQTYVFHSDGEKEYTISDTNKKFKTGTEVLLHLKPQAKEFSDHFRLKQIIQNYSDHIPIPIMFENEDGSITQINSASALWRKQKSEITETQYNEFFKNITHSTDIPWLTLHNHNEGILEFINLLYIPSSKTLDLFNSNQKPSIKLYIKRVFITDKNINIIPQYLRFLKGIVDSEDLPLNISRENLQQNVVLEKIKKSITSKVMSELQKNKDNNFDKYLIFWNNFGSILKEGLCEITDNQTDILKICLFKSTIHNKMISLDQYIENCKEKNKVIYYLSGNDADKLRYNPQIEAFVNKGIDVLLFTDPIDNFWVNINRQYKGIKIKSITRSDINLNENQESQNKQVKENETNLHNAIIKYFKASLGNLIKEVKISKKLSSIPVCLTVADGAMDIRMERYLIAQKQLSNPTAKILEVNPKHKIIIKLINDIGNKDKETENNLIVHLLYDQACIIEGEPVPNTGKFAKRINNLLEQICS